MLPVLPASQLEPRPPDRRWLVEELWGDEAVGILGGEPKCGKSLLALQLSVAVGSGRACLGRFAVARPGRVLLFAAEDALHIVRHRLEAICAAADLALAKVDIHVITASSLRLDVGDERQALADTVEHLKPALLVLDPFVRLHRIDENVSQQVAPLLAFLRKLQREHHLAVLVVHHARKGGGAMRAGQALRGSSEFHAWGDSNLYLRRRGQSTVLTVEHRAAAAIPDIPLRLLADKALLALQPDGAPAAAPAPSSPQCRIERALAEAAGPVSLKQLRQLCRIRTATLCDAVTALVERGQVVKTDAGYTLRTT